MFSVGRASRSKHYQQADSNRIKENITSVLIEVVKEIQHQYQNQEKAIDSNDLTNRLCSILEAIFIHGLKETFLGRLSARLALADMSPKMPEPSFWTFVLVFSHKEVISSIEKLSQVNSDVGRSRAWVRHAVNDGLLVSYLTTMTEDKVSLSVHYNTHAFLRDHDKVEMIRRYLAGVEVYNFSLALNSSILNRWQPGPVVLAGAWTAPLCQEQVDVAAVDVAASIVEEDEQAPPSFSRTLAQPIAGNNSYIQRGLLNEDEALRLILQSSPVAFSMSPDERSGQRDMDRKLEEKEDETHLDVRTEIEDKDKKIENIDDYDKTSQGKMETTSVSTKEISQSDELIKENDNVGREDKTDCDENIKSTPANELSVPPLPATVMSRGSSIPNLTLTASRSFTASPTLSPQRTPSPEWDLEPTAPVFPSLKERSPEKSYVSLATEIDQVTLEEIGKEGRKSPSPEPVFNCDRKNSLSDSSTGSPSPEVQQGQRLNIRLSVSPEVLTTDLIALQTGRLKRKSVAKVGFQEPPSLMVQQLTLQQNMALLSCLDVVCSEQGLDSQDWQCADCTRAIGTIFGSGRVCEYTKKYYCEECHTNTDAAVIPARLLYNWDSGQYKVARSSLFYLSQVSLKPIVDVRTFNPGLSQYAPSLDQIQQQRQKLVYLDAYLSSCTRASGSAVKVSLAEVVWPRDYLYQQTDLYSIRDLEQVHSGEMATILSRAVKVCLDHVNKCLVCRGRGFICELCHDKRPVYPFDLETTSQCESCYTVFHSNCSRNLDHCPKCERIAARSLNWHVKNILMVRTGGE